MKIQKSRGNLGALNSKIRKVRKKLIHNTMCRHKKHLKDKLETRFSAVSVGNKLSDYNNNKNRLY